MQIFCLFHLCILYRVGTAVFCNFLSVYLLTFLHVRSIYAFPWLPYFFQWFFTLLNFFLPNFSCLPNLLCCRFFRGDISSLLESVGRPALLLFWLDDGIDYFYEQNNSVYCVDAFLLLFVARFNACFVWCRNQWLLLVLRLLVLLCCFHFFDIYVQ